MLPELVAQDGGVEPVEGEIPAVNHVHQRIQDLGFLSDFVSEAEVIFAFDKA